MADYPDTPPPMFSARPPDLPPMGEPPAPEGPRPRRGRTVVVVLAGVALLAGGFTALAEKNQVRVTRRDRQGTRRTFVLRVEDIVEGRAADFDLEPDDVIFVPESIT